MRARVNYRPLYIRVHGAFAVTRNYTDINLWGRVTRNRVDDAPPLRDGRLHAFLRRVCNVQFIYIMRPQPQTTTATTPRCILSRDVCPPTATCILRGMCAALRPCRPGFPRGRSFAGTVGNVRGNEISVPSSRRPNVTATPAVAATFLATDGKTQRDVRSHRRRERTEWNINRRGFRTGAERARFLSEKTILKKKKNNNAPSSLYVYTSAVAEASARVCY